MPLTEKNSLLGSRSTQGSYGGTTNIATDLPKNPQEVFSFLNHDARTQKFLQNGKGSTQDSQLVIIYHNSETAKKNSDGLNQVFWATASVVGCRITIDYNRVIDFLKQQKTHQENQSDIQEKSNCCVM